MKTIFFLIALLLISNCKPVPDKTGNKEKNDTSKIERESTPYTMTVNFYAPDSLLITANLYVADKNGPVIVYCHQARFNKYEYDNIAKYFAGIGFNGIAVDQRSGGPIGSTQNETFNRAEKLGLPTGYLDAEKDIIAAINFAYEKFGRPVILWGSSYSAALALYIAPVNDKVAAVVAFSPGDYLADSKGSLKKVLKGFNKPMFVTSSKSEAPAVSDILSVVKMNDKQVQFIPKGPGYHGSKALWQNQAGGEEYWEAIKKFFDKLKTD